MRKCALSCKSYELQLVTFSKVFQGREFEYGIFNNFLGFICLGEPHDREDVDVEGLSSVGQDHRAAEVGRPHPDHRQRRRHVHDERQRISGLHGHAKDNGF